MFCIALLIVAGLAINSAVECYHHSAVFAPVRAYVEAYLNWFSDLMGCPYCLSYHVGYVVSIPLVIALSKHEFNALWPSVLLIFPFWLAAVRISQLINDVLHKYIRTPKFSNGGYRIDFKIENGKSTSNGSADATSAGTSDH